MGREIRRVPPDWKHPTYKDLKEDCGHGSNTGPHPCFDEDFDSAMDKWNSENELWKQGKHPDQNSYPEDRNGGPPDPNYYRKRKWTAKEATHYQMYETVSEGTPCSPVFAAKEELVEWLVNDGIYDREYLDIYGKPYSNKCSREAAEAFVNSEWCCSMVVVPSESGSEIKQNMEGLLAMKQDK
jgi:hypothetical protein